MAEIGSSHAKHWIEVELQRKVEDVQHFGVEGEIIETDPVQDGKGQWWKTYKPGEHVTYKAHFADRHFEKKFTKQGIQDFNAQQAY